MTRGATYGFDAPGIMLTLLGVGISGLAASMMLIVLTAGWLGILGGVLAALSLIPLGLGSSMLVYGLVGKHRMRDRMIDLIDWSGDEQVLDIGTGRGLLLIAAAKQLGNKHLGELGRATGIDIWRKEDLSDNSLGRLNQNIALEGVEDRVVVIEEDARRLSFPDSSFDVVLSLFCIHNIEDKAEQRAACSEIARVLKPGGRVLVGEWLPTHAYADAFVAAGLTVTSSRTYFGTALSPMWMVDAEKPPSAIPAATSADFAIATRS